MTEVNPQGGGLEIISDEESSRLEPNPYLDPDKVFRSRYDNIVQTSQGLERFVFSIIPFSLIRSFAKLDPLYKFKMSPHRITPFNRHRVQAVTSSLDDRKRSYTRDYTLWHSSPHYGGITGKWSPPVKTTTKSTGTTNLTDSVRPNRLSDDTTDRTRPWYSHGGTFQTWEARIHSPPLTLRKRNSTVILTPGTDNSLGWNASWESESWIYGPSGLRIATGVITNIKTAREASLDAYIGLHGPAMLKSILPNRRNANLFRSIAELHDIPRTLHSLERGVKSLANLGRGMFKPSEHTALLKRSASDLKDLPDHWLSYWFGWHTLYRDVIALLGTPERVAKRVNYLIRRSGKETTYRTTRKFVNRATVSTPFSWDSYPIGFTLPWQTTRDLQEIELRAMISANFDFPWVDVPEFRKTYFMDKLGIFPTMGDLYQLVPWSWLGDWFTGVGNYLDLVEAINGDPTIYNYGYITADMKGEISTLFRVDGVDHHSYKLNPDPWVETDVPTTVRHTSILEYRARRRKDISEISDVSNTSDLDSLSPWQKSILGALFLQRYGK